MAEAKIKRPTLKTIANMAGLGVTTVSKALKDAPDIAQTTKQRVRDIADQVGYRPDKAGLRLRTGKTNIISLVMNTDEKVDHMTSEFIVGIMKGLGSTAYNLILTPYDSDDDPMEPIRYVYEAQAADGIILTRIEPNDQRLVYLDKVGMPFATHGRSSLGLEHAYFDFDCGAFGREAVHLLAELGCKRPCMVYPPMHLSFARYMQEGYYEGLEQTGLADYAMRTVDIESEIEEIAEKVCSVLNKRSRPDSFICSSVKSTIGVFTGIEKAGLTVGRDVQIVVKQSKTNQLKWFAKPIYYVEEDFVRAGMAVANCLLGVLGGDPVSDHQSVMYTDKPACSVLE